MRYLQNLQGVNRHMIMAGLTPAILVFLLLFFFRPFEYSTYPLQKLFLDSLLSAILVYASIGIIQYSWHWLSGINKSLKHMHLRIQYGFLFCMYVLLFMFFAFFANFIFGDFYSVSFQQWVALSLKYVFIFSVILVPIAFFVDYQQRFNIFSIKMDTKEPAKGKRSISDIVFLPSMSGKEVIRVEAAQLLLMRSYSNYVEVVYEKNGTIKVDLLRNTLTNIQKALPEVIPFCRSHRSYIVNINKVVSCKGNKRGYELELKGWIEKIPVARTQVSVFEEMYIKDASKSKS